MYTAHTALSAAQLHSRPSKAYMHCSNLTAVSGASVPQERKKTMIVSWILSKVRNYLQYRETVAELSRLTDRELADLGISRFDIETVARNSTR